MAVRRTVTTHTSAALRIPLGLSTAPEWFDEARGLFTVTDSSWGKTGGVRGEVAHTHETDCFKRLGWL